MIDHRTHTDITGDKDLGVARVGTYPCGCELRRTRPVKEASTRWFLCPWHAGFDIACERFAP